MKFKITSQSGRVLYKDFSSTYSMIAYCDKYFRENYEADLLDVAQEENKRLAEIVEENAMVDYGDMENEINVN